MKKSYNNKKKNPLRGLLEWDEETSDFLKIDSINSIELKNLFFIDNQKKI